MKNHLGDQFSALADLICQVDFDARNCPRHIFVNFFKVSTFNYSNCGVALIYWLHILNLTIWIGLNHYNVLINVQVIDRTSNHTKTRSKLGLWCYCEGLSMHMWNHIVWYCSFWLSPHRFIIKTLSRGCTIHYLHVF